MVLPPMVEGGAGGPGVDQERESSYLGWDASDDWVGAKDGRTSWEDSGEGVRDRDHWHTDTGSPRHRLPAWAHGHMDPCSGRCVYDSRVRTLPVVAEEASPGRKILHVGQRRLAERDGPQNQMRKRGKDGAGVLYVTQVPC